MELHVNIYLIVFILIFLVKQSETSAIIEIRLLKYDLNNGTVASGSGGTMCCDAGPTSQGACPPNQCDPYFYICLQDVRNNKGCHLGELQTGFTSNNDHLRFSDTIGSSKTSNPIIFKLTEYGGTLIPTLTVYDEDKSEGAAQDDKIDYLQYVFIRQPDYNNNRTHVIPITMQGQVSSLKLEMNVRCDVHYYGNDCKTYCVPGSDTYCDEQGKSVCIPGKPCDPNRTQPTPPPVPSTTPSTKVETTPPTKLATTKRSVSSISAVMSPSTTPIPITKSDSTVATTAIFPRTASVSLTVSKVLSSSPSTGLTTTALRPTTKKTTTLMCHLVNRAGKPFVSLTHGSNVTSFVTKVATRLAQHLNTTASEIKANMAIDNTVTEESAYTLLFHYTGSGLMVNQTLTRRAIQDVCQSTMTRTATPLDNDQSHIAIIAGAVSASVLAATLTPLALFLYKRKCRRSKVENDETKASTIT